MSSIQSSPFYRTNKIKLQILKRREKVYRDGLKDENKKCDEKNAIETIDKYNTIEKSSYRIKGMNNKFEKKNKNNAPVKNQEFKKFLCDKKRQVSER